jgi:hypothetical protein
MHGDRFFLLQYLLFFCPMAIYCLDMFSGMYQIIGMLITLLEKRPVSGVQNWLGEGLRQGRLSSLLACPFALIPDPLAVLAVYISS